MSDAVVDERLKELHEKNHGVYGVRKMWRAYQRAWPAEPVARCTIARRMQALGLQGVPNARTTRTTKPAPGRPCPQDKLGRDFTAPAPDHRWVADITYVATWTGFVYVAFVMDLYSRRIVGWRVSTMMRTDLPLEALEQALWERGRQDRDLSHLVHHSDRGSQGGFKWSSQHLDRGGVWWRRRIGSGRPVRCLRGCAGSGVRIGRCGRRCGPPGGRSRRGRCSASSGV